MGTHHGAERALTIAVMQPYFIPYAGYFRLLAESDIFVIYDCVQFPRRGWVHRNRLHDATGKMDWLTLPLQGASQDVLIRDLAFRDDARTAFLAQARRFPALQAALAEPGSDLSEMLSDFSVSPTDYIVRLLRWVALKLEIDWNPVRSSDLKIDPELRGQDRILSIIEATGASSYINAPGGVDLYDRSIFEQKGIDLRFLSPYSGAMNSIIERLVNESPSTVRSEIITHN